MSLLFREFGLEAFGGGGRRGEGVFRGVMTGMIAAIGLCGIPCRRIGLGMFWPGGIVWRRTMLDVAAGLSPSTAGFGGVGAQANPGDAAGTWLLRNSLIRVRERQRLSMGR